MQSLEVVYRFEMPYDGKLTRVIELRPSDPGTWSLYRQGSGRGAISVPAEKIAEALWALGDLEKIPGRKS